MHISCRFLKPSCGSSLPNGDMDRADSIGSWITQRRKALQLSRVALQAAAELRGAFGDGVVFVPLAPIHDPSAVLPAVAQALAIGLGSHPSLLERLQTNLHDRHLLLVLDNFEQVAQAAPQVAAPLAATARLKILVTSRMALDISAEHRLPV